MMQGLWRQVQPQLRVLTNQLNTWVSAYISSGMTAVEAAKEALGGALPVVQGGLTNLEYADSSLFEDFWGIH